MERVRKEEKHIETMGGFGRDNLLRFITAIADWLYLKKQKQKKNGKKRKKMEGKGEKKKGKRRIAPRENLFHLDYDDSLKVLFTRLTNESVTFYPRNFSFSNEKRRGFSGDCHFLSVNCLKG